MVAYVVQGVTVQKKGRPAASPEANHAGASTEAGAGITYFVTTLSALEKVDDPSGLTACALYQ